MSTKKDGFDLVERLKKAGELTNEQTERVTGGESSGRFKLVCSNKDCLSYSINPFAGATPGALCGVCKIGYVEKVLLD